MTFAGLDPSVAAAASSAGVSRETLAAMRTMLGGAAPAASRLMEPKAKTEGKTTPAEVLSESDEEVTVDASGSASGSSMPLEAAFGQIAGIMKLLTEDKLKKKKASKVEAALDAVSGGRRECWERQKSSSCKGHQTGLGGKLGGDIIPRRTFDDGRLVEQDDSSWNADDRTLCPRVGRAPFAHRRISGFSSCGMGCRRNTGRFDPRFSSGSKSKSRSPLTPIGSVSNRLDAGQLPRYRNMWDRRRVTIQQASRPSLERDSSGTFEGHGGLPYKETRSEQKASGRGRFTISQEKTAAEVKGKSCSRHASGCMIDDGGEQSAGSLGGCDTKKVYVPGEPAATVKILGLWNSFGRLLSKHGGGLASFFQSMCSSRPSPHDDGSPGAVVWPIPIPYVEFFMRRSGGLTSWKKRRLCLQIVTLDWLWLGPPSVAPFSISLGQKLTSRQRRTVRLLEHLAGDGNSPTSLEAAEMGRVAAKAENSADEIAALQRAVAFLTSGGSNQFPFSFDPSKRYEVADDNIDFKFGRLLREVESTAAVTAKPIQADRISFVGRPSFDPQALFDKDTLMMYDDPLSLATPVEDSPLPPVVKVLATAEEKVKLFKKLASSGRLQIFDPSEVFPEYAGVFSR